jgi:hypothetical protein
MKNLIYVVMLFMSLSSIGYGQCVNGSCSRPLSKVGSVTRTIVAAPVRVVENIVTNKPVRKVLSSPFRAVKKYRGNSCTNCR